MPDSALYLGPTLDAAVTNAAATTVPVLLVGETGVGKTRLARVVHAHSARARRAFVHAHCAEFAEVLIESEIFGHERGAFTGAVTRKLGLVEGADGGVLFLDDVDTLDPRSQAKLLRLLDDGRIRRVGALTEIPLDIRVISATNANLQAQVGRDAFRGDRYFRLRGVVIRVPPLRERIHEVPFLAEAIVRQVDPPGLAEGKELAISQDGLQVLQDHDWPGNLRELKHVLAVAQHHAASRVLGADVLRTVINSLSSSEPSDTESLAGFGSVSRYHRRLSADAERRGIVSVLSAEGGVMISAARRLGMHRQTLWKKIREHEIHPGEYLPSHPENEPIT